uniref:Uncharacterized protein n=1 Tax=Arundo donax TaxID=35708 RepID=A0A0A9QE75_ARUDO
MVISSTRWFNKVKGMCNRKSRSTDFSQVNNNNLIHRFNLVPGIRNIRNHKKYDLYMKN